MYALDYDSFDALTDPYIPSKLYATLGPLRQAVFACPDVQPTPASAAQLYSSGVCYSARSHATSEHTLV